MGRSNPDPETCSSKSNVSSRKSKAVKLLKKKGAMQEVAFQTAEWEGPAEDSESAEQ